MRGRVLPTLAALLIAGRGDAQILAPLAGAPTAAPVDPQAAPFAAYLSAFRARAIAEGVRTTTVDAILPTLSYSPRVVALDRAQPGNAGQATALFVDYLADHVDAGGAAIGQARLASYAAELTAIERATGVPAAVIVAIWGRETSYGSYVGNFDLFRSLATLAFDGRRRALFEQELIAALTLVDRGVVSRDRLVGSWAGATGQPQFMPSTVLRVARDGDGDGRADIWSSAPDTFASIAAYLAKAGWRPGLPWGMRVQVPLALDRTRVRETIRAPQCTRVLAAHSRWIPIREWRALGLVALDRAWPGDEVLARLIEPDGPSGGGYLTFGNYRAILDYNCSNFYALSVGLLADAIAR